MGVVLLASRDALKSMDAARSSTMPKTVSDSKEPSGPKCY